VTLAACGDSRQRNIARELWMQARRAGESRTQQAHGKAIKEELYGSGPLTRKKHDSRQRNVPRVRDNYMEQKVPVLVTYPFAREEALGLAGIRQA
jgi:hypothetical protein